MGKYQMVIYEPPESLLYVCAATRYGPVNMLPVYHLGKNRVKHMAILRGVHGADDTGQEDEAIRPASRLEDFAFGEIGVPLDSITMHDGDPDSMLAWYDAARAISAMAREKNLAIILNMAGGTKQTASGMMHFLREQALNVDLVFIAKYPAAPTFVSLQGNELVEGQLAAMAERVPTWLIIAACGVEQSTLTTEDESASTYFAAREAEVREISRRAFVSNRGRMVFGPGSRQAVAALNLANGRYHHGEFMDVPEADIAIINAFLDPAGALQLFNGTAIQGLAAIRFANNGWLEYYIYLALRDAFQGNPAVELMHSVPYDLPRAAKRSGEIDVLLRIGDQLHLVEVKGQTSINQQFEDRFANQLGKLQNLKRLFGGSPARAWFVAPFLTFAPNNQQEWQNRATDAGVKVLTGPAAVMDLVDEVRTLID